MPAGPPPEGLGDYHAPGPQGQRTVLRPITGFPPDVAADHRVEALAPGAVRHAVDHLLLVYLADQYPPRSFYRRVPASATHRVRVPARHPRRGRAVGDDFVPASTTRSAPAARPSTSGQQASIWSRGGVLLATTEQLAWYR